MCLCMEEKAEEEVCEGEANREKAERPGLCHTRPGQSIREIGETVGCTVSNQRPLVWSAGHCQPPDSRRWSVSVPAKVCVCVCVCVEKIKDVIFRFILFNRRISPPFNPDARSLFLSWIYAARV